MNHLSSHWHHWVSVVGLLAAGILTGVAGDRAVQYVTHGGYRPGPLPPRIVLSGAALPAAYSLDRYLTRVHNQGASNSCVGQTLSTMVEIVQHERRPRLHRRYSAGYIWNQVDLGRNQGISYEQGFAVLLSSGDARLRIFPWDGATGWGILPSPAVRRAAYPNRFLSWRSIAPADRTTMEAELVAGRPLAVAFPVYDSFYYSLWSQATMPVVASQSGAFRFWHSTAVTGYTPVGLEIVNSWGAGWGFQGHALLTWSYLVSVGAQIVVGQPLSQPAPRSAGGRSRRAHAV